MSLFTAGCASDPMAAGDPLEPMNRVFFDFNQRLDRHAALPAATFYTSAIPRPVRGTVHNVLNNLGGPVTAVNDILQLEFENAGIAAGRFLVNTTIGIIGIFDVATDWGMPQRHRDFGENYVQELTEKQAQLPTDVRWHFIGHLQSNKVKYIAPFVHMIHAVDGFKLLLEINKQAQKLDRVINVLLQLHIAAEETKYGMDEKEIIQLLDYYEAQKEQLGGGCLSG